MGVYIGTSGYTYEHWKGIFYPPSLKKSQWFEYYQQHFDTVELNVTFYRLPSQSAFQGWKNKAKEGFVFAVKGSRFITHIKRLNDVENSVKLFMERCKILGDKLGPVLWQLPPSMKFERKKFQTFLRVLLKTKHPLHAIEIRNPLWLNEECIEMIKKEGFTLSLTDYPGVEVNLEENFPFLYIRKHGVERKYGGSYPLRQLRRDAELIKKYMKKRKPVFVYFNNDEMAYAVKNALELKNLIPKK